MPDLPKSVVQRMKAQGAPQEHPDADLLTAFSEQALTGRERENVLAHLAACAACREAVALASPQPVALQPGGIFVPWYKRPSIFAWAGTLATVAVIGALVLNYSQSRYAPSTVTDSTPLKAATSPPAENKPAAPPAQAEVNGRVASSRAEARHQPAAADKAEPWQKKRADAEHASRELAAVPGGAAAQVPAKDEKKLDGGVLQDQFRAMKQPATGPPSVSAAQAPRAAANAMEEKQQVSAGKEADVADSIAAGRSKSAEVAANAGVAGMLYKSKTATAPSFRWSISDKGKLQRSADQGHSWQPALASETTVFRALAVVGNEVWAGGSGATLLHSTDGASWIRQTLPGASADVVSLQFADTKHGTARTADGIAWSTSDGGLHWASQGRATD